MLKVTKAEIVSPGGALVWEFEPKTVVASASDTKAIQVHLNAGFFKSSVDDVSTPEDVIWGIQKDSEDVGIGSYHLKFADLSEVLQKRLQNDFRKLKSGAQRFERCLKDDVLVYIAKYIRDHFTFLVWGDFWCLVRDTVKNK